MLVFWCYLVISHFCALSPPVDANCLSVLPFHFSSCGGLEWITWRRRIHTLSISRRTNAARTCEPTRNKRARVPSISIWRPSNLRADRAPPPPSARVIMYALNVYVACRWGCFFFFIFWPPCPASPKLRHRNGIHVLKINHLSWAEKKVNNCLGREIRMTK